MNIYILIKIVTFRAIVYRPFIDEVIVGKIKSCTKEKIQGIYSKKK